MYCQRAGAEAARESDGWWGKGWTYIVLGDGLGGVTAEEGEGVGEVEAVGIKGETSGG